MLYIQSAKILFEPAIIIITVVASKMMSHFISQACPMKLRLFELLCAKFLLVGQWDSSALLRQCCWQSHFRVSLIQTPLPQSKYLSGHAEKCTKNKCINTLKRKIWDVKTYKDTWDDRFLRQVLNAKLVVTCRR